MSALSADLIVLDVHGVVLNNPLRPFLRELAERTGQVPEAVVRRWDTELRLAAWTGRIDDVTLWARLAGRGGTEDWRALLESRYELGPAAPYLDAWRERVPLWLLSNHRSEWLLPRLERFGLADRFDRVWVSDALGAAKPDPRAFEPVLRACTSPDRALFVDDQAKNVRAARALGMRAWQLTGDPPDLSPVHRAVLDARTRGHDDPASRTPMKR